MVPIGMKVKITPIGATVFVRLPLDWKRQMNLKKDSFVDVRENAEGNLVISPLKVQ